MTKSKQLKFNGLTRAISKTAHPKQKSIHPISYSVMIVFTSTPFEMVNRDGKEGVERYHGGVPPRILPHFYFL